MNWLAAIAKSLFSSIIEGIVSYIKEEKAEAAKWEAKARKHQLESIKSGKIIEKQLEKVIKSAKNKNVSVSDWNSGLLILLCVLPFLSGCFRFYVHAPSYRPVPPHIERPIIPEDIDGDGEIDEWNERENILKDYALQLEAGYNTVRDDAQKHNEAAGFPSE